MTWGKPILARTAKELGVSPASLEEIEGYWEQVSVHINSEVIEWTENSDDWWGKVVYCSSHTKVVEWKVFATCPASHPGRYHLEWLHLPRNANNLTIFCSTCGSGMIKLTGMADMGEFWKMHLPAVRR